MFGSPPSLMLGPPPAGAQSLLRHLGLRGQVDGEPLGDAWTSDEALAAAATALRRFHDAQAGYDPPPATTWSEWFTGWPARKRPVICHNEFGPAHAVRRPDGALELVDFALVAPGPRLLDVAYSAWTWVPLTADLDGDRPRRLRLFADVYGLSVTQRTRLVGAVRRRIVMHLEILRRPEFAGAPWRPLVRSLRALDLERHRLEHAVVR